MEEIKFYNIREHCIPHFLHDHPGAFEEDPENKGFFIELAEEGLSQLEGAVRGWEYEIDYNGWIDDFYWETWVKLIKPKL